jgi:hypothetical protein
LFLLQEFQAKNNTDLSGAFAGDELAMRFVFALSSRLPRCDVVGMTEAVLTACGKQVGDMEEWMTKEWEILTDPRKSLVEDLVLELAE